MPLRIIEWSEELSRTGNLAVVLSTDESGMSYARALPTENIEQIVSQPNDVEQVKAIIEKAYYHEGAMVEARVWPAYNADTDAPDENGKWPATVLHFAINRPVGGQWGESDLAPILKWLSRHANWLEDRVRLNRFRQTFAYILYGKYRHAGERAARASEINTNPPGPGSVLVADESEKWDILSPKLESHEANTDGEAIKKMIAAGAGVPLHFLAEPESSTRTTAEAAGGPTYRWFEQRQNFVLYLIQQVLEAARRRRALIDTRVAIRPEITVTGGDISARDNAALAISASTAVAAFNTLHDKSLIDDSELLRMVYKFAGEAVNIEELLAKAPRKKPVAEPTEPDKRTATPTPDRSDVKIDKDTGETRAAGETLAHHHEESHRMGDHIQLTIQVPQTQVTVQNTVEPTPVQVAAPTVNNLVEPAAVQVTNHVLPAPVNVEVQPAPMQVTAVPIQVTAPDVRVTNTIQFPTVTETAVVERDEEGRAVRIEKTYE
jgi:hypothetical protein